MKISPKATLTLENPPTSSAVSSASKEMIKFIQSNCNLADGLAVRIEVAIHEMLRNAYEHGSLGIGFEEKRELLERANGEYEQLLKDREELALAGGKKIHIELSCSTNELEIVVEDEGDGFVREQVSFNKEARDPTDLMPNGRGLFMIENTFDEVSYANSGRKISVRKLLQ
jgi:anti-sigma regulatory factor (Ser/Thr protein kinase)